MQVKSGKVGVKQIRDFAHVIQREKAIIGLFLTLEDPTQPMLTEAASAGVYEPTMALRGGQTYPRLQILTIRDLLDGVQPTLPIVKATFKSAPKAQEGGDQLDLL